MKVAIVGPGSIGSTFAFHLARAGHDVTVVARGARLAQLEKDRAILKAQVITDPAWAEVFSKAGIATHTQADMHGWLRTHAALVAPVPAAVRSRFQPVGRPPSRRSSVSAGPSSRPSSARSSSVRTGRPRFRSTSSVVTSPGSK